MKVVPKKETMEEVSRYLDERFEELEIPMKADATGHIVFDEIYSNIVYYSGASFASIDCELDGDFLCMEFRDDGVQYNPLEKEDPDLTLETEERPVGGLGIFMVKNMVADFQYAYEQNENVIRIKIKVA
ncbi:MAG: ATP-binding protein [Clostridia bacterium]|nr:ATP-binding protein [Clostridia bacterium]